MTAILKCLELIKIIYKPNPKADNTKKNLNENKCLNALTFQNILEEWIEWAEN